MCKQSLPVCHVNFPRMTCSPNHVSMFTENSNNLAGNLGPTTPLVTVSNCHCCCPLCTNRLPGAFANPARVFLSLAGPDQANFFIKKPSPLRLPILNRAYIPGYCLDRAVAPTTVMASLGRCCSIGRKVITSGLLRSTYRPSPDSTRLTLQPCRIAAPVTIRCYTTTKRHMGEDRALFLRQCFLYEIGHLQNRVRYACYAARCNNRREM